MLTGLQHRLRAVVNSATKLRSLQTLSQLHCSGIASSSLSHHHRELPLDKVVKVHCSRNSPDRLYPWQNRGHRSGTGSGFIIEGQRIITNAHVVSDATFITITKDTDGTHFPARVEGISHESDLAILRVLSDDFFDSVDGHLEFGELPHLEDTVTVLGFPLAGDTISVTRGVVSRLEMTSYVHASHNLLAVQIDAAINSGNSGGPTLMYDYESQQPRVIGVAFQNVPDAEAVGWIIPSEVVRRFLTDLDRSENDKRRGFCSLGVACQPLTDTHTIQAFLQDPETDNEEDCDVQPSSLMEDGSEMTDTEAEMKEEKKKQSDGSDITGVLVKRVVKNTPADGVIEPYDIIMEMDGRKLFNDGMSKFVRSDGSGRHDFLIGMDHWITQKFEGDSLNLKIFRDGQLIERECAMRVCELVVPRHLYDMPSDYYIFGGCVFQKLSVPFLRSYGEDWYHNAPRELVSEVVRGKVKNPGRMMNDFPMDKDERKRKEPVSKDEDSFEKEDVVILSSVLPHALNMGCDRHCSLILERVGNVRVKSLRHLKYLIEQKIVQTGRKKNLLDFEFGEKTLMVLPIDECVESEEEILGIHGVGRRQSQSLDDLDIPLFETEEVSHEEQS